MSEIYSQHVCSMCLPSAQTSNFTAVLPCPRHVITDTLIVFVTYLLTYTRACLESCTSLVSGCNDVVLLRRCYDIKTVRAVLSETSSKCSRIDVSNLMVIPSKCCCFSPLQLIFIIPIHPGHARLIGFNVLSRTVVAASRDR